MLRAAGFAEVATNTWSDRMIDAVVLWGNEAQVEERLWIGSLKHFSRRAGAACSPAERGGARRWLGLDRRRSRREGKRAREATS
jgi:hypothetical protein